VDFFSRKIHSERCLRSVQFQWFGSNRFVLVMPIGHCSPPSATPASSTPKASPASPASRVRLNILSSGGEAHIRKFQLYNAK
jgi:hypothetical protein